MAQEGFNLKIDTRRKRILDLLGRSGQVRVEALSALLKVTPATVRNDLAALEKNGYLQRISGGAIQTANSVYHADFLSRLQHHTAYKKAVGEAVAALVEDGETLFINAGVTMLYAAACLRSRKKLNILTNSIAVAMELGVHKTHHVTLLGGEINVQYGFTHGAAALEQLSQFRADKAILSIDGISLQAGLTTYHPDEAPVDQMMMERARKRIIAADYSKLGFESFLRVADVQQASVIVTNSCASQDMVAALQDKGIATVLC